MDIYQITTEDPDGSTTGPPYTEIVTSSRDEARHTVIVLTDQGHSLREIEARVWRNGMSSRINLEDLDARARRPR